MSPRSEKLLFGTIAGAWALLALFLGPWLFVHGYYLMSTSDGFPKAVGIVMVVLSCKALVSIVSIHWTALVAPGWKLFLFVFVYDGLLLGLWRYYFG